MNRNCNSNFCDIARGLFWKPNEAILMIWAYYDESGVYKNGELQSFTIGCCVSTLEKWIKFDKEWKDCLYQNNLNKFHMTDFEAWQDDFNFKLEDGERDYKKHKSILNSLLDIMVCNIEGFYGHTSTTIKCKNQNSHKIYYEDCIAGAIKNIITDVYSFYQQPINLVFDKHNHFSEFGTMNYCKFYDCGFDQKRIADVVFSNTSEKYPLQAADIIAYEMARRQRPEFRERYPFKRLQEESQKRGIKMTLSYGPLMNARYNTNQRMCGAVGG